MKVCIAETLWQCDGGGLVCGGWVGEITLFDSVGCAVELKHRLGVYSSESTFV